MFRQYNLALLRVRMYYFNKRILAGKSHSIFTSDLPPVCRIMYQARDISATVGCLGLITSSIISKKVGGW